MLGKYELSSELFETLYPDLYLYHRDVADDEAHYMAEVFDVSTPFWVVKKRIRSYQAFGEEHDFDHDFPHILLIVENTSFEARLCTLLEETYDDFSFFVTTLERLTNSPDPSVWIHIQPYDDEDIQRVAL